MGIINHGKVIFLIQYDFCKGNKSYSIADFSNWVPVPSPQFTITSIPESINLRPYDQKVIRVEVQSNTSLAPQISLDTGQIKGMESVIFNYFIIMHSF